MMEINLIARTNGVGLDADVSLVKAILEEAGHNVTVSHARAKSFWSRLFGSKARFDLNIFMERVFPNWLTSAKKNMLFPNQERFPVRHLKRLNKLDLVLCKSRHAEEIFSQYLACQYVGFTSKDLYLGNCAKKKDSFFHLAGRSTLKGTETLLKVWAQHPEWPKLTLLQHEHNAPSSVPKNVELITVYVSENQLVKWMNSSMIHLCPSLSEGWGHYIVEAMACEAVVITTDGPPMHELVDSDRGFCVAVQKMEPRHLGVNHHVCPEDLEAAIEKVLMMSFEEKKQLGKKAREWFIDNHEQFKKCLLDTLEKNNLIR